MTLMRFRAKMEDRIIGWVDRLMPNGMLPAHKVPAARFSLPRSYAVWVAAQIVLYFLAIALLVEGIFLSEHFIDLVGDLQTRLARWQRRSSLLC